MPAPDLRLSRVMTALAEELARIVDELVELGEHPARRPERLA